MTSATQAPQGATGSASQPSHEQIEWQRLWFSLRTVPWQVLAIVGIDGASFGSDAAKRLVEVATRDEKTPVGVISALGMSFQDTTSVVARLREGGSGLTLVVCDSPAVNPAAIPIVHAVSGVVLVVKLGEARLEALARAVDVVGRDKVLATITVG